MRPLLVLLFSTLSSAQYYPVGDNSTIRNCVSTCAYDDLLCWEKTADFFDKALIAHLRYYAVVQVDDDQWYRRHIDGSGKDLEQLQASVYAGLESQLTGTGDLIDKDTMDSIAALILDQIEDYSDHIIGWPPQYQCPIPCEYREELYFALFILSLFINGALVAAVVPYIQRISRMSSETSKTLKEEEKKDEMRNGGSEGGRGEEKKGNGGLKEGKGEEEIEPDDKAMRLP